MESYTEPQVRDVLEELGIEIIQDTSTNFMALCPFHGNVDTPALSVSKEKGLWMCFNDSCGARGTLSSLVARIKDIPPSSALRIIGRFQTAEYDEEMSLDVDKFEYKTVDAAVYDSWQDNYQFDRAYAQYFEVERGFSEKSAIEFYVGGFERDGIKYVVYPVHTPDGSKIAAFVARSIEGKRFYNMPGMQRSRLLFNLHNARKHSQRCVVVESGFDAMKVHEAGHKNVVATMGSKVTKEQILLLERNFSSVLSFADNDKAGEAMTQHLEEEFSGPVLTARMGRGKMYPNGANDPGDLSPAEIRHMIKNADTWI